MQCTSNKYEMILKLLENKGPINGSGKKACQKKMKEITLNQVHVLVIYQAFNLTKQDKRI